MKEQIKQIISEIKQNPLLISSINDDAHLMHDIGLTSLEIMSLMLRLERDFDLEIDVENIKSDSFKTISKLCNLFESK